MKQPFRCVGVVFEALKTKEEKEAGGGRDEESWRPGTRFGPPHVMTFLIPLYSALFTTQPAPMMSDIDSPVMFKKRSRPAPRTRKALPEDDTDDPTPEESQEQSEEKLDLADLIELRKLRKAREGIDVAKLTKGEVKKKRKRPKEEEEVYGLRPGAATHDNEEEEEDAETKARKVVRANNFTQQTNALDVDKHMMAYIEENMKLRKGETESEVEDEGPADPYAELFRLTDKADAKKKEEEGNVTNSLAMLTAIPEVDLGMECVIHLARGPRTFFKLITHVPSTRLKNIEETEKAKRLISEQRKGRSKPDDEAHLAAARFYRPNLKAKSDADIMRDAKLEAMGMRSEDREFRRHSDRVQMATDEMVMERFKKRMRK
ncbi:hepatocellular carcinoma-associated antigen 59-domain-containing protein [Daedaleopsis nitida]|nr:hepatocellular carcinoma-associated antigen 59-domain-containing protein [Daedaleopsis nitida]